MSDHNVLINQFESMTGSSQEQAQFYLEASNWDLEVQIKFNAKRCVINHLSSWL